VVASAKSKTGGRGAGESIAWRGRVVPVRTAELRHAVTKAQEQDFELLLALQRTGEDEGAASKAAPSENQFSRVIGGYEDALAAVRKHEHTLDAMVATTGGGSKVEQERADLALLKGALGHSKSMRMLTRSRRLVGDLKRKWRAVVAVGGAATATQAASASKPEDIVHLYGGLKQILEEALKLPGVEDDDELVDELSSRLAAVRAQRCYFLAETHTAVGHGKKAVVLYDHAAQLAASAADALQACGFEHGSGEEASSAGSSSSGEAFLAAELAELAELGRDVAGAKSRAQAQAVLQSPLVASALGAEKGGGGGCSAPLLERLSEFDAGLVELGGKNGKSLKPTTTKKLKGKKAKDAAAAVAAEADAAESGTNVTYKVASVPPALEAVPCKPMLFNLAHNFIDFPDLDAKAGVKKQPDPAAESSGGGLFGWFRS